MSYQTTTTARPRLQSLYDAIAPFTVLYMRAIAGIALMVHGWPKIQAPMGNIDMVQGLGFYPGWLFSPALAATEFFGGLLLLIGLLTRPAALAASFVLLITVYFHWVKLGQGYSGSELSLIWVGVTLYFVAHGGGRYSVDRAIGKEI
ncbi:DoxX family protein [Paracoccus caeni]|uniref:DoxX family protein n=1 Tax=Paracoccus caeni TaxID=657651 RepID=A0A934VWG9_9RHOB|nr:DoxX family protein [Paracoccus caeni]MBK4218041.1 DoxX family protein [Paracoccus caeni]